MLRKPFKSYLRSHWLKLLGVCALLAVLFGNQGFIGLARNWIELRRLRAELACLEREHALHSRQLKALRSSDFALERMARRELGYIKPGEIEYRFPPPEPMAKEDFLTSPGP